VFWRKKDARAMRKKEYWANATRSGAVKLTKVGLRVTSSLCACTPWRVWERSTDFFKWKIELPLIICSFGYIHSRMSAEAGINFHLF